MHHSPHILTRGVWGSIGVDVSFDVVYWSHWLQGLTASCCLTPARARRTSCHGNSRDFLFCCITALNVKLCRSPDCSYGDEWGAGQTCYHSPHGTPAAGQDALHDLAEPLPRLLPRTWTQSDPLSIPLQAGHWVKPINWISRMVRSKSVTADIPNNPAQTNLNWQIPEVSLLSTALILPSLFLGVSSHALNFTLSSGHQLIILIRTKLCWTSWDFYSKTIEKASEILNLPATLGWDSNSYIFQQHCVESPICNIIQGQLFKSL